MHNDELMKTPRLGFGMMRLPKKGLRFDESQIRAMVDTFMEAGFTYFDTAYVYPGSEKATRKALVERYPREAFTLASKMYALPGMPEAAVKREFRVSLRQAGVDFFDYYLLHSLMDNNYRKYEKQKLWEFAMEEKAKGKIRHVGFSYHDGPELLDQILTHHPETEFVQLQLNYLDWEDPKVCSRANYEVAREHDVPIVVMEPVKGGKLADPPEEVRRLMLEADNRASYASWAIRFVAALPGVMTVLSGMSTLKQVEDNVAYMKGFRTLSPEEEQVIHRAREIMTGMGEIPCTDCRYCLKGCPRNIPIPEIFASVNKSGCTPAQARRAAECVECGACEAACPQHIGIIEELKKCAGTGGEAR
ncbi:aldo/keto reductase [Eubacterium sp. AB3007]|uniref:aldo/keto reductase n=1 Tax=Eubacterium sp. AB3007 TaxID=1392487 RepID=UPI000A755391